MSVCKITSIFNFIKLNIKLDFNRKKKKEKRLNIFFSFSSLCCSVGKDKLNFFTTHKLTATEYFKTFVRCFLLALLTHTADSLKAHDTEMLGLPSFESFKVGASRRDIIF